MTIALDRPLTALTPTSDALDTRFADALAEFTRLVHEGQDMEKLLRTIGAGLCDIAAADQATVFLAEGEGRLRSRLTFRAGRSTRAVETIAFDPSSPLDRVLRGQHAVLVDSSSDSFGALVPKGLARAKTIGIVPMTFLDRVVGVVYLDYERQSVTDARPSLQRAESFVRLAAGGLCVAQSLHRIRTDNHTMLRDNKLLRSMVDGRGRLDELMVAGGSVREFAHTLSVLLAKPVVVVDSAMRRRAASWGSQEGRPFPSAVSDEILADPEIQTAFDEADNDRAVIIDSNPAFGLSLRCLTVPIVVGDDHWGRIIVPEHGAPFTSADLDLISTTAQRLTMSIRNGPAANSLDGIDTALMLDLLRGAVRDETMEARMAAADLTPIGTHVVCLLSAGPGGGDKLSRPEELAALIRKSTGAAVGHCVVVPEGAAAIVTLPSGVPTERALHDLHVTIGTGIARSAPESAIVGALSTPFTDLRRAASGYVETKQVIRCRQRFNGAHLPSVMRAEELGAGSAFIASSDISDIEAFARSALQDLLDVENSIDLICTLHAFLATSRNIRRSARQLDIHENTVRYRLGRVEKHTGLRIMLDSADQMRAELALLVLRLQGMCPWDLAAPMAQAS